MFHSTLKNKDINLLDVYTKKKESSKYTSLVKYSIFPLVMAILLFAIYIGYYISNSSLESKIADTTKENTKLANKTTSDLNFKKYEDLLKSQLEVIKYELIYDNLDSYPSLNQKTFDEILIASGAGVDIITFSYNRESSSVSLQVESKTANSTEQFVRRLKTITAFSGVDYSGYIKNEKATNTKKDTTDALNTTNQVKVKTETVYTATIFCLLSR